MRRWKKVLLAVIPATLAFSFTSLAGQWHEDMNGWWYENDDGSYHRNGWYWVDGDQDGLAECYYFGNSGYVADDTGMIEGYEVTADGAWEVDGEVQTKEVPKPNDPAAVETYLAAEKKFGELNALDADMDAYMAMEVAGETVDMGMDVSIKMKNIQDDDIQFLVDGSISTMGEDMPFTCFYADDYLYTESADTKIKMEMPMGEILQAARELSEGMDMENASLDMITDMEVHEDGENTVITYRIDTAKMNDLLNELLTMAVMPEENSDMTWHVNSADGEDVIDKNGYYTKQSAYVDMSLTVKDAWSGEAVDSNVKMEMNIFVNKPGEPVEFKLPSTKGYKTMEEWFNDLFASVEA